jgi:hypothetical protein
MIPAEQVADVRLCEFTLYGNNDQQMIAQREANRRGLDCRQYYPAIMARRQQQTRALQDAAQFFNRPPPPPPPLPQSQNCVSRIVGNHVYTNCN